MADILADSVQEFSNKQGQNNWLYGYYDIPFQSSSFKRMEQYSFGTDEFWKESWRISGEGWTALSAKGGHPNGLNTRNMEQWAVRRWQSENTGTVTISGLYAMVDGNCGDGTTGYIFVDGVEVWFSVNRV